MHAKIAPSLMCADLLALRRDIAELERAQIDLFHIDVMDGHFVPNLALSLDLVQQITRCTRIPLDVHLMVERPESFIENVRKSGAASVSFHIEATNNPIRLARSFKSLGLQVGIAMNPATPAEAIAYLVDDIDFALLMTVEPGYAGQKFIPQVLGKISAVRELLDASGPNKELEVDGNLNVERSRECIAHGASILVGGTSSIFRPGVDVYTACQAFRQALLEPALTSPAASSLV